MRGPMKYQILLDMLDMSSFQRSCLTLWAPVPYWKTTEPERSVP